MRNQAYVAQFCRKGFPGKYPAKGTHCDEYPFNASCERAEPCKPANFSVRPVPAKQNVAAGNHLNEFYRANRMLDGDKYRVRTTR